MRLLQLMEALKALQKHDENPPVEFLDVNTVYEFDDLQYDQENHAVFLFMKNVQLEATEENPVPDDVEITEAEQIPPVEEEEIVKEPVSFDQLEEIFEKQEEAALEDIKLDLGK